jgi:hypothetical protein
MAKRRFTYTLAAIITAVATVFLAVPAQAATGGELTVGSLGGTNVNVNDNLTALLTGSAVFTTSAGKVTCTQGNIAATDNTNPAEGQAEATLTLTQFHSTPASCTTTISGTTKVISVDLAHTASLTVLDDPTDPGILRATNIDVKVTLGTVLGSLVCDYGTAGTVTQVDGALNNTAHSVTYSGAAVNKISGTGACPASGTLSAVFGPIIDTTQANQNVYVN